MRHLTDLDGNEYIESGDIVEWLRDSAVRFRREDDGQHAAHSLAVIAANTCEVMARKLADQVKDWK